MDRYILEPVLHNLFHAGSKAREDINYFLGGCGYKLVSFRVNDSPKIISKVINYISCLINLDNTLDEITPGSLVLIQYPYPCRPIILKSVLRRIGRKGVIAVALVHDLNSLRFIRPYKEIKREIDNLNTFHHIISHNTIMTQWLKSYGLKRDVIDLEIFDYRMNNDDRNIPMDSAKDRAIVFSGNLSINKSGFLYSFNDDILKGLNLYLYGVEFSEKYVKCKNIIYKGVYQPDELPSAMEGDYGLVWDGDDIETCSGCFGQYLRYNNPHKLSLYIAAGIPVIAWKQSAISGLISKNKIGIMVDSLTEISDAISEIDDEQYVSMKNNVLEFKNKVTKGYYIQDAVRKIEDALKQGGKL